MMDKLVWQGHILGVQPRIRLYRSFDQRSQTDLGYLLRVEGSVGGEERIFTVSIGPSVQMKHGLVVGDQVQGECLPTAEPQSEPAEFYKVSKLKVLARGEEDKVAPPPWQGLPPPLDVYRERGFRRLATRTYDTHCTSCIWGCRMAVEIIVDQWNPGQRRYRSETFCYGPKSCIFYKAGPPRQVPGRKGMSWTEADWIDDDATDHRSEDE
jgi:hypothetical protein